MHCYFGSNVTYNKINYSINTSEKNTLIVGKEAITMSVLCNINSKYNIYIVVIS